MINIDLSRIDWQKMGGLIPVIVQDAKSTAVLMLAYMNEEALQQTLASKYLTFYSRSKKALWLKGETSGNKMCLQSLRLDCDGDSLLAEVIPAGPACHLGLTSCFQPTSQSEFSFLASLIQLISQRAREPKSESYTYQLISEGLNRCAQKVGEEAVETVIAAVSKKKDELINEAADLFFHLLILLQISELSFFELLNCLQKRHKKD